MLWEAEGLWRSHEKPQSVSYNADNPWYNERYRSCYPSSDIIGHGDKNIMQRLLSPSYRRNVNLNNKTVAGPNDQCDWLSLEKEKEMIYKYCLFNSPACKMQSGNACVSNADLQHRKKYNKFNKTCSISNKTLQTYFKRAAMSKVVDMY